MYMFTNLEICNPIGKVGSDIWNGRIAPTRFGTVNTSRMGVKKREKKTKV